MARHPASEGPEDRCTGRVVLAEGRYRHRGFLGRSSFLGRGLLGGSLSLGRGLFGDRRRFLGRRLFGSRLVRYGLLDGSLGLDGLGRLFGCLVLLFVRHWSLSSDSIRVRC